MDENIKNIIKVPKELDDAILRGFEAGKKAKKKNNKIKIMKKLAMAASISIISISLLAIVNPDVTSAIPFMKSVFEYINSNNVSEPVYKYKNLSKDIGYSIEKNGVKFTLDKMAIDDNLMVATFYVESDKLSGYDFSKPEGDFFNLSMDIFVNGDNPSSYGESVRIVNKNKAAVMIEANLSEIDLDKNVKVKFNIDSILRSGRKIAKGPWKINIDTVKGINSKVYLTDESIISSEHSLFVEKLMITPLSNTLFVNGRNFKNDYERKYFDSGSIENNYIIRDNNGNILTYDTKSRTEDEEGNYKAEIRIFNDLDNAKYIEIIKAEGNETIIKEINEFPYDLLKTTVKDEKLANRSEEVISREVAKEEKRSGYALDKVRYWVSIDRNNSFEKIEDLIGKEVKVNSNDKVTITNIEATDKKTKITMKIDGAYKENLLNSIVIFDEDMNDISRVEGGPMSVLEDVENQLVSITLGAIDKNKKYTIAIPVTTDLKLNEDAKVTINLKN